MRWNQIICLCAIAAASGCGQEEQVENNAVSVEDARASVVEDGPAPCVARPSPAHLAALERLKANGADCSYLPWFQQENGDQPVGIVVDFTSGWHGDVDDIFAVRDIDLLLGYVLPPGMADEQLQILGETPIMLEIDVREIGNDTDERQRVEAYFPEGNLHGREITVVEQSPAPCVARPSPEHLAAVERLEANGADCSCQLWFQQENGDQPVGIVVDFTPGWRGEIDDILAVRDIDLLMGYVLPPGMADEQLQVLGETPIMLGVDVKALYSDSDERERVDGYFPEGRTLGWEGIDSRTRPLIYVD